jgi:hypothetical protein
MASDLIDLLSRLGRSAIPNSNYLDQVFEENVVRRSPNPSFNPPPVVPIIGPVPEAAPPATTTTTTSTTTTTTTLDCAQTGSVFPTSSLSCVVSGSVIVNPNPPTTTTTTTTSTTTTTTTTLCPIDCSLTGSARLIINDECDLTGSVYPVYPPCNRPDGLGTFEFFFYYFPTSASVPNSPVVFTSSLNDACNACDFIQTNEDFGYGSYLGQSDSFGVGSYVYLGRFGTCEVLYDGYYLTDLQTCEVTRIVDGYITSITYCNAPPPPPTTTTTTTSTTSTTTVPPTTTTTTSTTTVPPTTTSTTTSTTTVPPTTTTTTTSTTTSTTTVPPTTTTTTSTTTVPPTTTSTTTSTTTVPPTTTTSTTTSTTTALGCQQIFLYPANASSCGTAGSLTLFDTDNAVTPTKLWVSGQCGVTPVNGGNLWYTTSGPGGFSYQVDSSGNITNTVSCP